MPKKYKNATVESEADMVFCNPFQNKLKMLFLLVSFYQSENRGENACNIRCSLN